MDPFQRLGPALRWLRLQQRRQQAEVAETAGLTRAMLSAYETGRKKPSLASLGKLMETLAVDLEELHHALALQRRARISEVEARRWEGDPPPGSSRPS